MIYTKRQFQEGVTFYTDNFTGNVYDIDIDQDVTELYLSGDKAQHYVIKEIRMYENKKRFPQIERIYIADSVMSIRIPNKMFPNVKEIISDSKSFQSGNLLIRKALGYAKGVCLFNTFCKKADELIDLNGVETIAGNAFDGCESSNIINAGGIKEVCQNAFYGYKKISELPVVDGVRMLGNIVMDCQPALYTPTSSSVIPNELDTRERSLLHHGPIIPKQARLFNYDIDFTGKPVTVQDISVVKTMNPKKLPQKIILNNNGVIDMNDVDGVLQREAISEIEISPDNPYFTSHDGILYNSDMTVLVRCPAGRTGKIIIPDGVKAISECAFYNCSISEVVIPDSVTDVEQWAFRCCHNLEKITFSKNMSCIKAYTFSQCTSLHDINIPGHIKVIGESAFSGIKDPHLDLSEGVEEIETEAFRFTPGNDLTVALPSTIKKLGCRCFGNLKNLAIDTETGMLPNGFFSSIGCVGRVNMNDIKEAHRIVSYLTVNGKSYLIPYIDVQLDKLDRYFRFLPFNPDVIWRQYEKINTNERLFRFLILLYPTIENAEIKKDIEKTFKHLQRASVNGLYKKGEFKLLVRYLSYNLSTKKMLENLVAASERDGKPEIKAYALIALQAYETKTEKTYKL